MTDDDVSLAEEHGLFRGSKKSFAREHHLVAVRKYGCLPAGRVVRHLNGIKDDNRPENLVLGTTQENTMDHNTARLAAMYWRERYEQAVGIKSDPAGCVETVLATMGAFNGGEAAKG